jgi:uncharacterized RDD family membrane protein YckC
MKASLPTFALFFLAQLLLWVASEQDNLASGEDVLIGTILISLFVALFYAGYRWARWVAAVLLGFIGLLIVSLTFEGFGFAFLSIALLYGAVIVMLFRQAAPTTAKARVRPADLGPDVIDWLPTPETTPPPGHTFRAGEELYAYPLLVKRYQSVMIDAVVLFSIMIITMVIMGESEARQTVMVAMGVIFALVYEPLLITYAATLGQYALGIRVRNARDPRQRINILQGYIRIVLKLSLGWLSLLTINFNPQHRAIHDLAAGSVVVKVK